MKLFASILLVILACGSAAAQSSTSVCSGGQCVTVNASGTGAHEYAVKMNNGRFFRHDPAFRGPEVIFRSSGQATPEQANQWWMNSPPHRRLLVAGLIQDVQCVGSVCVGRGVGASVGAVNTAAQPIRNLAPLKSIRVRFKRCR